ncbi:MAG: hypothetical protein QNK35_03575, partial [Bacteroides sp.]|nr:hypothetical protein [Bacteroides sp.]
MEISVSTINPTNINELSSSDGLALVDKACLNILPGDPELQMVVGRDVIVPVMNSNNPQAELISQRGITPQQFVSIYKSNGPQSWGELLGTESSQPVRAYMSDGACASAYLAEFTGVDPGELLAEVSKPEDMIASIKANPNAIGFCTLACLVELEKKGESQGISLVPLDRDGNGSLDHFENIYTSYAELSHGIFVGKYPRELYSKLYAISKHFPATEAETAFLEWMIGRGQETFASAGILNIDYGERASGMRQLFPESTIVADVSPKASSGRILPLVLTVIVLLTLLAWVLIGRFGPKRHTGGGGSSDAASPRADKAAFPAGLFFDRSHTWTFMEKNGDVRIGVDDFVQRVCGSVSRVLIKSPGDQIKKGDALFTLVQQGKKLVIHSPVSGVVVEHNEELFEDASLLNKDPYAGGWIYMVKPANWGSEMKSYFMGEPYGDWLKAEFTRLKDFFTVVPGDKKSLELLPVLQDGGEIRDGALEEMGPEVWEEFQTRFINCK